MARLKYKGHPSIGHTFRAVHWKVKEGRETPEISQAEADNLLRDYPEAFEAVAGARNIEKPVHDRMQRRPTGKRGKRHETR